MLMVTPTQKAHAGQVQLRQVWLHLDVWPCYNAALLDSYDSIACM